MNTMTSHKQILNDSDINGPMMIYKPMTENEEKELLEWVTKEKAKPKSKTNLKVSKKVLD